MKVVKQIFKNLQAKSGTIKKIFLFTLFFLFSIISFNAGDNPVSAAQNAEQTNGDTYIISVRERGRAELIKEVGDYLYQIAPETRLSPEFLVSKCLEYNMDLVFVIAQARLESQLGTKGKAAITNSVWNVGTYDNGEVKYTYKHPNESIEPYLKLLKDKYLINITAKGDTIYKDLAHLVKDSGYKNLKGERYATAVGYENSLRKLMVEITMETSIQTYQNIISLPDEKIIAHFGPIGEIEMLAMN